MVITFLCPAGHKLTSPPELAGKPGKCPKCGATFRVPIPEPEEGADAGGHAPVHPLGAAATTSPVQKQADSAAAAQTAKAVRPPPSESRAPPPRPPASGETAASAEIGTVAEPEAFLADETPEADDSHIVFLCPNGHRLHGPASLVGQPGQCPQCGIKFLVPSPDDVQEEDPGPSEEPPSGIQIHVDSSPRGSKGLVERLTGSGSKTAPAMKTAADSLPELFRLLWACKEQGGLVEVHLREGKVVMPDQFAVHLSGGEHAVFGLREAGGTHSVTVVPWTAITHVALRGLAALPKSIFPPSG
jgi:hypothetical protein